MISGGEVNSESTHAIVNLGNLEISNDANIINTHEATYSTISNRSGGIITINGGNITSNAAAAIENIEEKIEDLGFEIL